jgi:S1-C subfamily serine protease
MKRAPLYVLAVLSIGFVIGLVLAGRLIPVSSTEAAQAGAPAPVPRANISLPGGATTLPDLSAVAEAALSVSANVLSTSIERRRVVTPFSLLLGQDDVQEIENQSAGSGVVVSADGLILTNAHVIGDNATDIRVALSDGKERRARLVGIDELTDLAVLKVDATGLQTLPWGDSNKLRVAEWVLAIGNPFQLSGTVTLGIVSNTKRSQTGSFTDYVQTDAAVNPGNSGGALVNARGELVGINSAIFSLQDPSHAAYQGISFAIPSNTARQIMQELVDHGAVPWGSIGTLEWMDAQTALQQYGFRGQGLLVTRMSRNGAAYRAGIRPGDWILSYNGQRLTDSSQLSQLIARSKIGERVPIEIVRVNDRGQAERGTVTVTVESRAEQQVPSRRAR